MYYVLITASDEKHFTIHSELIISLDYKYRISWLEHHASTLFSKICQFLKFYLVKSSKKNLQNFIQRRRSFYASTVGSRYEAINGNM